MPERLAVEAHGLVKHFGETRAVDGVDLAVPPAMVYGFLGPNGAGKTTTLRMLATLLPPTAGTARVFGHDVVTEAAAVRSKVSMTGQFASVDEDLTGMENLVLLSRLWGFSRARARSRAEELLEAFGLADAGGMLVKKFSGGMRRRIDIAASIVVTPELMFLDEPTTGLDPESRSTTWQTVRGLVAQGTTVVLTSHYLEEVEQLADRIAVMHAGVVVREGTPAELVAGQAARIEFTLASDERLPELRGEHVAVRSHGTVRHVVTTHALEDDLRALLAWGARNGLSLGALDARSASLEQLFLDVARSADDATVTPQEIPA